MSLFNTYLEAWYHDKSQYKDNKEYNFKDSIKLSNVKKENPVDRDFWKVDKEKKVIIAHKDITPNKLDQAKKLNPGFKVQYL
jgi:hypothetical protein